jgi:hypothetical protein
MQRIRTRFTTLPRRAGLLPWLLAFCLAAPAWAGIDPDGDPARELRVEPHAIGKIALSAVRLQQHENAAGEHYVVLDYSIRNNTGKPMNSHRWSLTQNDVVVSGEGAGTIAPGATRSFSQAISGSGVGAFTRAGATTHATLFTVGRDYVVCPPDNTSQCEAAAAANNSAGICRDTCIMQGYQGGNAHCNGRPIVIGTDSNGKNCYAKTVSCSCSGEAYLPSGTDDIELLINIQDIGRPVEYRHFDRFQLSPDP